MKDTEIDDRFPGPFSPYLRKKIAHRLLHPVELQSPDFYFIMSLLYVMQDDPDNPQTAWQSVARLEMYDVTDETRNRCEQITRETIDRLRHNTDRLIRRMSRALEVLNPLVSIPPRQDNPTPGIDKKTLKRSYRRMIEQLSKVLYQEDPMGISSGGAPEYEPEARTILPRLALALSEGDAALIIQDEFSRWFGPIELAPETLATVTTKIWTLWQTEGAEIKAATRPRDL
jgi:hypothetical protein